MSTELRVRSGETLEFPVSPGHALAAHQELRTPTRSELLDTRFYSGVVDSLLRSALNGGDANEGTRNSVVDAVIANIGVGLQYHLRDYDILVEGGAVLSFQGSWNWIHADHIIIQPEGQLRGFSPDPQLPAYLLIRCNVFGTEQVG